MRIYLFIFICIAFPLAALAKTIAVGGKSAVKSIQQAINQAAPGDTILVNPGLYREGTITINKRLVVRGINYPVLDGERKFEVVAIRADGVILDGFLVQHAGYSSYNDIAAIRIYDARGVIIRNNKLEDTFFGIYTQHGTNCLIENNTLHSNATDELNSANGIHCWKSDSMQILNNTISGHRDGIYFEFVTNSIIKQNNSFNNVRYGLHFMFSDRDSYIGNRFINNGAGVAVMFSKNVIMLQNFFSKNWGAAAYGILLKEISDGEISGNHFQQNTVGVYMEGSNRILVQKNTFERNGWAIRIQASCDGNTITKNNFTGNTFDIATNGSLVLNSFDGNYWDKYEGYDLDRNGIGDIPYRPVSVYSMITERNPAAMMLFRSFMTDLLDRTERMVPGFTPEALKDARPMMKQFTSKQIK